MRALSVVLFLFLFFLPCSHAQQDSHAPNAASPAANLPRQKPIFLDVLVTDSAGKPVSDLEPIDFSILDENQPRKILGFRRTDGAAGSKSDPPVEVIIVLDALNVPYQVATRFRLEIEKFLRENDGRLAQPVSIYMLTSVGLKVQPAPSKDGIALATMLDQSTGIVRARDLSGGVYSLEEQFKTSYQTISGIAENLSRKPGRKVVIWLGPGWPLLAGRFFIQTNDSRATYFRQIAALENKLRDARVTIYSLFATAGLTNTLYQGYLKPVREARKMEIGNMALQVLALHTGGRVMEPSNDVKAQIDACLAEIGEYYSLAFMPPLAAKPDEYHEVKVKVGKPAMNVRTITGYYNEPPANE